jgi:hypothetical protein
VSSFFFFLAIITFPISIWLAFEIYGQSKNVKNSTSLSTIAILLLISCGIPLGFFLISCMLLG